MNDPASFLEGYQTAVADFRKCPAAFNVCSTDRQFRIGDLVYDKVLQSAGRVTGTGGKIGGDLHTFEVRYQFTTGSVIVTYGTNGYSNQNPVSQLRHYKDWL